MRGRLGGRLLGVVLAAAWVAAILWFATASGVLGTSGQSFGGSEQVERTFEHGTAVVWGTARLPLLVALLSVGASLSLRAVHRHRRLRRMRRFEVRLGREDVASPYKREKLFDAWHGQLAVRWWQRLCSGQPSIALEVHHGADGTQRLVMVCGDGAERMLEGRLVETYPDVRLVDLAGRPTWTRRVIRLKKRRLFIERLQTVKDDEQTLCEALVQTMAALGRPTTAQLVLTPAPWLMHRMARSLLKRRERDLTRADQHRREDIGVDSVVEDKELKGALETQHRSLYFVEIRIASDSREAVRAVAGAYSEARSENTLAPRHMILRRGLYGRRLALAAANPLPSFLRGVLSSSELATLWALPRQRAKGTRLVRSPVRRAPAPSEIARAPELALMRDEHGAAGLWPPDRKYGLALIGGQGSGKTSAMARTIAIDARDRDAAMVVLDPKHDLAEHALSLVPEDRTCWYMDLARPDVGIDPLGVDAEPGVVADMLVAALREAHPDGSIMAASDRFLRHAAMAVCAVEPRPTLWHMLELLSPRRDDYRERVTERLASRPEHAALLRYWGTSFPELWQDATRGQLGMALDAPRNKLERLITTVEVDKALRHPFPIDLRRLILERQVLIVNGALGDVGQDNAVTVMQLVIQLLHQALKQQQGAPVGERPRVCLKVDEAHLVLTPSFAELLALHRAAGLEVVAAWQYNAQLKDPVIRSGLRSLLRSVSMFAMGEVRDARDQAEVAMEVYTDSIKTEREDLERLRISPDDVVRLPVHMAVNSWVAHGARRSAFVATTFPMESCGREAWANHHLNRQREAGAGWPARLPPPGEVAVIGEDESAGETDSPAPPGPALVTADVTGPADEDRPEPDAPPVTPPPKPASYAAVHRDDLTGLVFDDREPDRDLARRLDPTRRDLEIMRAVWQCRMLLTSQVASEWWPGNDPSAAQRRLAQLASAGWLRRFRPTVVRGNHEWIYALAPAGLRLAQRHANADGPYTPDGQRLRDRRISDHRVLLHDLQVNGWVLAYRCLVRELAADWRGPDNGHIEVPRGSGGRRAERVSAGDIPLSGYVQLRGLRRKEFAPVAPDATLEVELPSGRRFLLMVELDRTRRPSKSQSKLLRYDALVCGWWRLVPALRALGEPPAVVFICQDEHDREELMVLAHHQVRGCLQNPGEPPDRWRYPGRERMLFVAERDVHEGSLAAWMLERHPTEGSGGAQWRAVQLPKPGSRRTTISKASVRKP